MISLKLNPVSDFKTDKPDELNRQLSQLEDSHAGRDLVIALSSGSNSVTVKPVAGAINGAASISISGIGATRIYSTGRAWYA